MWCRVSSSCLCCISASEAWGRCPSDYHLLQSHASSSKFCLWQRREKRLSWRNEGGAEIMMDSWRTGWDRQRKEGAAFSRNDAVCFLSPSAPLSASLSAAISEEMTKLESHTVRRGERKRANLQLQPARLYDSLPPLPFPFSPPPQIWALAPGWVSALSLNLLPAYHPLKKSGGEIAAVSCICLLKWLRLAGALMSLLLNDAKLQIT